MKWSESKNLAVLKVEPSELAEVWGCRLSSFCFLRQEPRTSSFSLGNGKVMDMVSMQ